MKLAVLADIHGNLAALRAAAAHVQGWNPDRVIVAGDVVNRGPRSPECLEFVLEMAATRGWELLRGNHEDYVIAQSKPDSPRSGPLFDVYEQSYWTYNRLGCDVSAFEGWQEMRVFPGPDARQVRVAHGSVLGNTHGVFPMFDEAELIRRVGEPLPALFCGGHTHWPFTTHLEGALVVNVGAVGLPFDGDWRAGYAQLTWEEGRWQANIVRLEYDRQQMLADYQQSGFLHQAGPMAWLVLAEFLFAKSQLYSWMRDYYEDVLAGKTTVEATVREQLERQGMWETVGEYVKRTQIQTGSS